MRIRRQSEDRMVIGSGLGGAVSSVAFPAAFLILGIVFPVISPLSHPLLHPFIDTAPPTYHDYLKGSHHYPGVDIATPG